MQSSPGAPSATSASFSSPRRTSQTGLCRLERLLGATPMGIRFDEHGGHPVSVAPKVLA